MDDKDFSKSNNICDIFAKMSYGETLETFNGALDWLKCRDNIFASVENNSGINKGIPKTVQNIITKDTLYTIYVPEIDTLKDIVSKYNYNSKWADTPAFERTRLLQRLALEIEKNSDIFAQLEMIIRGILVRDTKIKAVPLLSQYFCFYSGFAVKYNIGNSKFKPTGLSIGVISNENALANIGMYLAPALAAGYNIILQAGTKIFPSVQLIVELAQKIGLPQDVIQLISSDDGELLPYLNNDKVAMLTLMVDLNNDRYRGINNFNKKIISLTSYKTPIIVFDDADLDSACENVIESIWGYNGLNLWSADTILVQENVFNTFLNKLKLKFKSLRVGPPHDKTVDISNALDNLELIKLAMDQGLDVIQAGNTTYSPSLIVRGRIQIKKTDSSAGGNIGTLLPFRPIDEAVNLANNSTQGLGATVWSENVGVINEVTRKLNVSNIWINNSCGVNSANATISPRKDSGFGYFRGAAGFYEYVQVEMITSSVQAQNLETLKLNKCIDVGITNAKKAQDAWKKMPKIDKIKAFHKFAEFIEDNKKALSESLGEQWLDKWITTLFQCVTDTTQYGYDSTNAGYNFVTIKEPKGIIVIDLNKDINSHNIKLILTALFEGNEVILLDESAATNFYTELGKKLPNGVLHVFAYNIANIKTVSTHRDINAYFGRKDGNPIFAFLPIQDSRLFSYVTDSSENVTEKVTFTKNIWSDIGKSSTCNLGVY